MVFRSKLLKSICMHISSKISGILFSYACAGSLVIQTIQSGLLCSGRLCRFPGNRSFNLLLCRLLSVELFSVVQRAWKQVLQKHDEAKIFSHSETDLGFFLLYFLFCLFACFCAFFCCCFFKYRMRWLKFCVRLKVSVFFSASPVSLSLLPPPLPSLWNCTF